MIIDEYVETKISSANREHYKKLGYNISDCKNPIIVKIADLPLGSHIKINVKCDICGILLKMSYQNYNKNTNNQTDICTCSKCKTIKTKRTCLEKYGVENPNQAKEIKEKIKKTNLEKYGTEMTLNNPEIRRKAEETIKARYGVKNVFSNDSIKEKIRNTIKEKYAVEYVAQADSIKEKMQKTNLERYGNISPFGDKKVQEKSKKTLKEHYNVDFTMQSELIKNKIKNTNIKKYGVSYTFQSPSIREKSIQTSLEKYGTKNPMQNKEIQKKMIETNLKKYNVEYVMQSPEIREKVVNTNLLKYGYKTVSENPIISNKIRESLYKNGKVPTSTQQKYLHKLYGGILNYPCGTYSLDILLDSNIDVEFNGGGHNLKVKLGNMTAEEFRTNEIIRGKTLRNSGIKIMTIISESDLLPSDSILLNMLKISKKYLLNTDHTWIEFNIDNGTYRNAEDGISIFNYGELRKIKNEDVIVDTEVKI